MQPHPTRIRRRLAVTAIAILLALAAPAPPGTAAAADVASQEPESSAVLIRLLPPVPTRQGKVRIETLLTDPEVHNVLFLLDGEIAARRRAPPWSATLRLASPPREQIVRVEALDADDRLLGADEMRVNREVERLAVAVESIEPAPEGLVVRAALSLPEVVELERLELYVGDQRRFSWSAAELDAGPSDASYDGGLLEVSIGAVEPDPRQFVRLVAHLADGRAIEDVALVSGQRFVETVDVRLVQLQVVVTNRRGLPMRGFQKEHFRIVDSAGERPPDGLFPAGDVALLLGLALDSSGSMRPIWPETRQAAATFLEGTLLDRDEAFLVDFDTGLRLIQPRTGDRDLLVAALEDLEPAGGTALYDSILFSLLQFEGRQGRRGLVVLTDGYDIDSQADPRRAIEFGQRLGVPIYIVALDSQEAGIRLSNRGIGVGRGMGDGAAAVQELRLLTDPTGGRLYRAANPEQVARAFTLIQAELRNQYVLTYTTASPPEPGKPPEVRIVAPGHKGLEAKVVFGADQVY